MTTQVVNKSFREAVQVLLDQQYGQGRAEATNDGKIKYLFPETHNGCNEMECGTWAVANKKIRFYTFVDYVEAFEHLKCGSKPQKETVITLDNKSFVFPKDTA